MNHNPAAMERYIFETHYGVSTITDTETGVTVEWQNGKFNETNRATLDPIRAAAAASRMEAGDLAAMMARACREIGEHAARQYPDLI